MNSNRIKEIQEKTGYPNSVTVMDALIQVWNECESNNIQKEKLSKNELDNLLVKNRIRNLTFGFIKK
jgi:hypothetical protein